MEPVCIDGATLALVSQVLVLLALGFLAGVWFGGATGGKPTGISSAYQGPLPPPPPPPRSLRERVDQHIQNSSRNL